MARLVLRVIFIWLHSTGDSVPTTERRTNVMPRPGRMKRTVGQPERLAEIHIVKEGGNGRLTPPYSCPGFGLRSHLLPIAYPTFVYLTVFRYLGLVLEARHDFRFPRSNPSRPVLQTGF